MANFAFSTKLEILPPKIDMKDNTPKMRKAMNSALVEGTIKASAYVQRDLRIALDKAVTAPGWAWPGTTIRGNGSIAGTARNIIDSGKLKRSLVLSEKNLKTKTVIQIKYNTPYAAFVHYGGAIQPYGNRNANTVIIPGRPWIQATLTGSNGIEKFNMSKPMNAGFNEVWSRKFG